MVFVDSSASHFQSNDSPFAMKRAYDAAHDEDTRSVLNAMSNPSQVAGQSLTFYMLPCDWLNTALSVILTTTQPKKALGKIPTATLVASSSTTEHAVSSSSSSSDNDEPSFLNHHTATSCSSSSSMEQRKRRREKWKERQRQFSSSSETDTTTTTILFKEGLVHEQDYYLVGSHVWTLLSSKFGFEVALPRPVCCVHTNNNTNNGQLAVRVYNSSSMLAPPVPIPPSGRFSYGREKQQQQPLYQADAPAQADAQPQDADVVSEEDDDLFPSLPNDPAAAARPNDPILLLPPPATTQSSVPAETDNNNMMELENEENNNDPVMLLAATNTTKRKRHVTASGLGNLGNTCFMNSTVQCLAHTDPLRRYFLSGAYKRHLNRHNPLGTGGELATQFAELLREMWGLGDVVSSSSLSLYSSHNVPSQSSSVAYPRNFKYALGKHAEQFLGYDQHDSQEFATYLLDALHEDTNRVTNKPYIEKPEQLRDETDDMAADKAWRLHIQREDSNVLEQFMGQVKSRVQCPNEHCGRVSTTFDPFMYLSVPIPGASERSVPVTIVPLQGRNLEMNIVVSTTATLGMLRTKVLEQWVRLLGKSKTAVDANDVVVVDVWQHEVYKYYKDEDFVDQIRPNDTTFVYELTPACQLLANDNDDDDDDKQKDEYQKMREELSKQPEALCTLAALDCHRLKQEQEWMGVLERHMVNKTRAAHLFHPRRRPMLQELYSFYREIKSFVDDCNWELPTMHDAVDVETDNMEQADSELEEMTSSVDSKLFQGVCTAHDVDMLEFSTERLRLYILQAFDAVLATTSQADGVLISVTNQRSPAAPRIYSSTSNEKAFGIPLCLRIPSNTDVYGLREELARHLKRSLKLDYLSHPAAAAVNANHPSESNDGMLKDDCAFVSNASSTSSTSSSDVVPMDRESDDSSPPPINADTLPPPPPSPKESVDSSHAFGPPESLILRQIPLSYQRYQTYRNSYSSTRQLGMLASDNNTAMGDRMISSLATRKDSAEQQNVGGLVGDKGTVYLHWPGELHDQCFDEIEQKAIDETLTAGGDSTTARKPAKTVTSVIDCIEKYCQMEQLEETEMWYCSKCKDHVRAWKQFHLYRTPSILIIHLKRFHYSSSTHRRDKIDEFIDFPLAGLDLTKEVMHWTEEEKPIYDCYAVSNHYGGLGGGHYTAYAMSHDGGWCHFDDSRVTTGIDPKDVVSSAAYVLYYRRRDVAVDRDEWYANDNDAPPMPAIVQDHHHHAEKKKNVTSLESEFNGSAASSVGATGNPSAPSSPASSLFGSVEDEKDPFRENDDDKFGLGASYNDNSAWPPLQ